MADEKLTDLDAAAAVARGSLLYVVTDPGGTAASESALASQVADLVVGVGQCRLQVDSTTQISLQRYQGCRIPVKVGSVWTVAELPSSGPTLANTGLTAATLYYIYVYSNTGTLTLEASTTGHATDTDTGVEIKSGDATRTLVGMVYMGAGTPGTYVNSTAKRWCVNWFNRRSLDLLGTFSADRTTTSTTFAEINSEARVEYLTWADEAVLAGAHGTVSTSGAGNATHTGLGLDSTTVSTADTGVTITTSPTRVGFSVWIAKTLAEGYHYIALLGAVSGATGAWATATDPSIGTSKTNLWAAIRG